MSRWLLTIALPALLTGCGTFEARAPRPFAPHVEQRDGITTTESTFESADGWVHFERSWRPDAGARGVLVVVHGLKDHSARYADFALGLARRGIAVHAYDHRGHGRSDGQWQRVDSFDDYLTDLDSFVRRTKEAEPGLPAFVLGHSMGGAIATGYALDHQRDIAGLILSAPALSTDASSAKKFGAHVGTREFVSGVSSKDRSLWLCPALVHDLLHEPEGAAIADGVARWIEAHLAPESAAGAALTAPAPCRSEKP